ncbi:GEVED domain-containing protein [Aurantibacillus circumpalustris]|uniref:GEVED domain-containing protein n=1 Tax=Aurantibacillus circumpalustris TaxID=3036359 RepID=UPI00295B4DAB|nr:GEVED domain-containing protein [Aurantibacillus circumpalustris]
MKKNYNILKKLTVVLALGTSSLQAQVYCTAQSYSMYDEEITNVMLNGANTNPAYSFANACTTTPPGPGSILHQYGNFTGTSLTNLVAGTVSTFSVFQDECDGASFYYNGCGVWIDWNQNGVFTDPGETIFIDGTTLQGPRTISGPVSVPGAALTGSTVMRVIVAEGYSGSSLNPCLSPSYGEVEDYRIDVYPAVPCTGIPVSNSVAGPTAAICPNSTANLGLASNYTVVGLTYQWQSSTNSAVGPFFSVPGATNSAFSAPNVTVNTWYTAVITCTNSTGTYTTAGLSVSVQPVTINTVPYEEGFEGIAGPNKLPNCSWATSNLPANCQTYVSSNTLGRTAHTGSKFASFYYNPTGTNYFYTNGIQLNAGVTYSAGLWFQTDYSGAATWTDLSILYGTAQNPTGLVPIVSTNGPVISNVYKPLSNLFTVPSSGLYYIAIKAVGSSNCCAYYVSWDDLSITIPCTATSPNTPSVTINTAGTTTICSGDQITLNAAGADTYTWNTGSNAVTLSETPPAGMIPYVLVGTSALTGCTNTATQYVLVNATPTIYIVASTQSVCSGSPVQLQGLGASTYTWSNGSVAQNITVKPTVATTYIALTSDVNGCTGTATQLIGIHELPNVTASTDRADMCPTEVVSLSAATNASGSNVSFQWVSNISQVVLIGNPVSVSPSAPSLYTVTVTDGNGCKKEAAIFQNVLNCTGITERTILSGLTVYPNPTHGEFSIETANTFEKSIEIIDVAGKVVVKSTSSAEVVKLNLKDFSSGIYYVKIQSNNSVDVVKVVKQ